MYHLQEGGDRRRAACGRLTTRLVSRELTTRRLAGRQEVSPLLLIGYINSIFSAFDIEVKKQVYPLGSIFFS